MILDSEEMLVTEIDLSCNLPGFARNPKEGMKALREAIGDTFIHVFEEYVCDPNIPLNTDSLFICEVTVRFDAVDKGVVTINEEEETPSTPTNSRS